MSSPVAPSAVPAVVGVVGEGKMLSESLSTVKIQAQQMRRYLVRIRMSRRANERCSPRSPPCRNLTSSWTR